MSLATTSKSTYPFQTDDPRLSSIHEKIVGKQRLDLADVTALYVSKDILAIGWLANHARERKHGHATLCSVDSIALSRAASSAGCAMCGRRVQANDLLSQVEKSGQSVDEFVVLNNSPNSPDLEALFRAIENLKSLRPDVIVSALTVEEIAAVGEPKELCHSLRRAGADGLIGSGAEIFLPVLRHRMWHHAGTAEKRSAVRDAARAAGLAVPSILVRRGGSFSSPEQQAEELLSFRGPGGESFAAVSFDPDASTSLNVPVTTGMQEMKQIAIARLALDAVPHIRAYWEMLGSKLVQIALRFGASALDGTPLDETENLDARSSELAREIKVAGREPQQVLTNRKLVVLA